MFLNSIAVVTHPLPLIQVKRCGLENQCVTSLSISRHLRIKQTRSSRAYTSSMSSKATTTFLSPPPPEKLDASPAVCFLLLPGAFLTPSDYADLTEAIRKAADDSSPLALYLAIGVVDWTKMDPRNPSSALTAFNTAAEDALRAAQEAGFPTKAVRGNPAEGRIENVFLGMHSVGVLAADGFPLRRAAGAVLLGASLLASETFFPSIHTYPRPLMHIFGELDGQQHQCRAALSAAEAALMAPALGRRATSKERPVALISGMNHAQISNGIVNVARGDLEAEVDSAVALQEVAEKLMAFLTAHAQVGGGGTRKIVAPEDKEKAVDVLEDATLHAAQQLSPYTRALGRISAEDLLTRSENAKSSDSSLPQPLAYARGAEAIHYASPALPFTAHPGEIHAAEVFAVRAQKRALEAVLPADVVAGIPVAAVVHTSELAFIHSQGRILSSNEAPHGVALQVHCLLQRDIYPEKRDNNTVVYSPMNTISPVYALKLKSGHQVAAALQSFSVEKIKVKRECDDETIFGAQLSTEMYEEALKLVGERAKERFLRRGTKLQFHKGTEKWAKPWEWISAPLQFTPLEKEEEQVDDGSMMAVSVPNVMTEVQKEGPFDEGAGRFAGVLYCKCVSLAWACEYVLVAGLRKKVD